MEDFYKYNRAYYIKFKQVESDTYLNNYIFPNFAKILEESGMDAICVEEDENGQDCMLLFLEDIKIEEFIRFCTEEDIFEYHEDISYRLLTHDNLEKVILKMIYSDEYGDMIRNYKSKNHSIDSLLDKISCHSEESLEPFEIEILQREVGKNRTNNLLK